MTLVLQCEQHTCEQHICCSTHLTLTEKWEEISIEFGPDDDAVFDGDNAGLVVPNVRVQNNCNKRTKIASYNTTKINESNFTFLDSNFNFYEFKN